MLSLFKKSLFNQGKSADFHVQRLAIYEQELGEREYTFLDRGDHRSMYTPSAGISCRIAKRVLTRATFS